jgi:hypothetical protein
VSSLPAEIRNLIYSFAFGYRTLVFKPQAISCINGPSTAIIPLRTNGFYDSIWTIPDNKSTRVPREIWPRIPTHTSALLKVCRQIYTEARVLPSSLQYRHSSTGRRRFPPSAPSAYVFRQRGRLVRGASGFFPVWSDSRESLLVLVLLEFESVEEDC